MTRGRSPGRQTRKPHVASGTGAGVPHPQPADRPPRHGMGKPEAGRPGARELPRPPAGPRPPSAHLGRERPHEARAPQQPRRRLPQPPSCPVAPPTASVVTSCSAPGAPPPGVRSRRSASRFRCAGRSSGWRLGAAAERQATEAGDSGRGRDGAGAMEPPLPG